MKKITLFLAIILMLCEQSQAEPSPTPIVYEKLQSALADTLNKSIQVAGDAKDFLVSQLPEVIRQLLLWKMAESIAKNLFAIALLIFVTVACKKYIAFGAKREWELIEDEILFPVSLFVLIFTLGALLLAGACANLVFLQIWVAPKVYLIEYAKSLSGH